MYIVNLLLCIMVLVFNGSVFVLFAYRRSSLVKNPSNRLLHSLSMCDFLAGVGVIFHILIEQSIINSQAVSVRIGAELFTTFIIGSSVFHLLSITGDRALSIFYALRYKDIMTHASVRRLIASIWIVPFLTSFIQITYLFPFLKQDTEISMEEEQRIANIEMWYSIVTFSVYMALPCLIMAFLFVSMFREIQNIILRTPLMHQDWAVMKKQKRVLFVFGLMYLCFILLSMPHFTFRIYLDVQMHVFERNVEMNAIVLNVFYTMKTTTSLCNPFIYTVLNKDFRTSFKNLCCQQKESCSTKFYPTLLKKGFKLKEAESFVWVENELFMKTWKGYKRWTERAYRQQKINRDNSKAGLWTRHNNDCVLYETDDIRS